MHPHSVFFFKEKKYYPSIKYHFVCWSGLQYFDKLDKPYLLQFENIMLT